MRVTPTPEMIGRANALAPELKYETVKAMLEAALEHLPTPISMEIRNQVIADSMPALIGGFLRQMRLHQIALVFHDGGLEGGKATVTAREALAQGSASYASMIGEEQTHRLVEAVSESLWDASSGLQAAKLV